MFSINEWLERYEVNDKGQPAKKGDKLRVRPLDYIRSKVHGRDEGAGFHAMRRTAKSRTWEVFGIFQKFLEIAGDSGAYDRGKLLNQRGGPASISDLAHILRTTETRIRYALQVLTDHDVAWINSDSACDFPGIPGIPGALNNETEEKGIECKVTEGNKTEDKENSARAEFDTLFWPNVPNKIGKGKAREAYIKARKKTSAETILAGLSKYQAYEDGRKSQTDYRALHPATWLNGERWDDEEVKAKTTMDKINEMKVRGEL